MRATPQRQVRRVVLVEDVAAPELLTRGGVERQQVAGGAQSVEAAVVPRRRRARTVAIGGLGEA